jgi:hypothetical protein
VYDIAFSFAGTERALAEQIATIVRNAGFNVFFDSFYPEQLWGKDLVAMFDRIYPEGLAVLHYVCLQRIR